MTVQGVSCLFCRADFEIAETTKCKRKARVLSLIHSRLCSALKLDFPKKLRKWNFSKEPFPFCPSCQKVILRLSRLMDQFKALELEISRCVSTLSMLTINSKLNSAEFLINAADPEADVPNSRKADRKLEEKRQYFRNAIIQRFNTKVRIKRCDSNPSFVEADPASPNPDAQQKDFNEVNFERQHDVIATDNYFYADVEDDICLDSSPVSPEPGSPPGGETWDSCPSSVESYPFEESSSSDSSETPAALPSTSGVLPDDSVSIPTIFDVSEISNSNSIANDPPSPSDAGVESAESDNEHNNALQESGQQRSEPEKDIVEACDLDIKIEPLEDPSFDSDPGSVTNVTEDKGTLLDSWDSECESQPKRRTTKRVKERITAKDCSDPTFKKRPRQRNPIYFVQDLGEGLYELSGFGFKELDKGFECSTCKVTFPFSFARPEVVKKIPKWEYIKRHIQRMHISKRPESERACVLTKIQGRNKRKPDQEQKQQKPSSKAEPTLLDDPVVEPLANSVTRSYAGFEVSVGAMKARCLKCGLDFERKAGEKSSFAQAKKHITQQHVPRNSQPLYEVEVVNKEQKLYRTMGHEFQELDNGCKCSTCNKIFPFAPARERRKIEKWRNIKNHILIVHKRKYGGRCEICNKDVAVLKFHMKKQHGGESGRGVCELCGKEFKSTYNLYQHRAKVHTEREPKLKCEDCGEMFVKYLDLKSHQQMHEREKPYICEHCGKEFRFKESLNVSTRKNKTALERLRIHVARAHGERKFACDQCVWKFTTKYRLDYHVKQVHERIKRPRGKKRRKEAEEPREESEEETPEESDSESDTSAAGEEEAE